AKLPRSTTRARTTRSRSSDIVAFSHESDAISCLVARGSRTDADRMRLALLVLAGCNQLLHLDETTEIDAAIDAPPPCAPASTAGQLRLQPVEDTPLMGDGSPQQQGAMAAVRVRVSLARVGLWRCRSAGALDGAVDVQLVLPYLMRDDDC